MDTPSAALVSRSGLHLREIVASAAFHMRERKNLASVDQRRQPTRPLRGIGAEPKPGPRKYHGGKIRFQRQYAPHRFHGQHDFHVPAATPPAIGPESHAKQPHVAELT